MISPCFEIECALVQNRRVDGAGSSNRIAEDLAPFGEAAVGGEDHGALLVAGVEGLEEQIAAAGNTRCVSSPLGTLSHVLVKVGGRVCVFL
jgi:23S rRNA pseudoU1915 N3-methylase RlmH